MTTQYHSTNTIEKDAQAVANYVQTVHDLSVTPLFAEGHPNPLVGYYCRSDGERDQIEFSVADPYVLRAALVPFRKLWLPEEPCSYYKIVKILERHHNVVRWYVDFLRDRYSSSRKSTFSWRVASRQADEIDENPLPAHDIIDLWLNSRLFHSGKSTRRGRFTQVDFEHERERIGPARFEYLFNAAVYDVAMQSTNLIELAQYTLEQFRNTHPETSSGLDMISRPGIERFADGTIIRRSSPGVTPDPCTPGEKLTLLRRENAFSSLDRALELLGSNNEAFAYHILVADNCESFLKAIGLRLVASMPNFDDKARIPVDDTGLQDDPEVTDGASGLVRKGNEFWTSNVTVLDSQLRLAKEQLISRSEWIPGPQPVWKRSLALYGISFPYSDWPRASSSTVSRTELHT